VDGPPVVQQLKDVRGEGSARDGLVWAQVDGTGQLADIVFDPEALDLAPAELAVAVKAAISQAQTAVQPQVAQVLTDTAAVTADQDQLAAMLSQVGLDAERRMNEFSTAVYDLLRQVSRR
jgi:DNA-binding protein YbaB